jgi:hypothetical protein
MTMKRSVLAVVLAHFGFPGNVAMATANNAPEELLKNETTWEEILNDPLMASIHLADTVSKQRKEIKRRMIERAVRKSK